MKGALDFPKELRGKPLPSEWAVETYGVQSGESPGWVQMRSGAPSRS
jgi:hypothetical protein